MLMNMTSMIWPVAVVLGTVALGGVLMFGWLRSQKKDNQIDPGTPADDPSKGMK
jgi:hypothetical protein